MISLLWKYRKQTAAILAVLSLLGAFWVHGVSKYRAGYKDAVTAHDLAVADAKEKARKNIISVEKKYEAIKSDKIPDKDSGVLVGPITRDVILNGMPDPHRCC